MNLEPFFTEPPVMMDLDVLDTEPGPYCMSFGFELTALTESIKLFGLLNPPFVTAGAEGKLDVVPGYRRLLAAKALKEHSPAVPWRSCWVTMRTSTPADPAELIVGDIKFILKSMNHLHLLKELLVDRVPVVPFRAIPPSLFSERRRLHQSQG